MTTQSTLPPQPPAGDLEIDDIVDRHDGVTVADIHNAEDLVRNAINASFDGESHGMTREEFTQLVCHCFYMELFDCALTSRGLRQVAADVHTHIAQLSA
ncbi:hypothetical protein [Streptomyces sp. NPDC002573]|uniref:hypothetical protein n=1 Tax=Streptomyces sp. NPDC002573 TaxID=3364651 RepID=UPI0036C22911